DDVAGLDVLKAFERDAALEALLDLADIVLKAPERLDLAFKDDDVVAQDARRRPADRAVDDIAAGDLADARHAEDLAHLGVAGDDFALGGVEQAEHRQANLFFDLVDNR